jgi:hypothetical protein
MILKNRQKILEQFFQEDLIELEQINLEIDDIIKNKKIDISNEKILELKRKIFLVKVRIIATEKYLIDQLHHCRQYRQNKFK